MPLVLAVLLLPVVVYCSLRAVAPRLGGASTQHRRDTDAWHVLMGTAMTAMLLGVLTHRWPSRYSRSARAGCAGASWRSSDAPAERPTYGSWSAQARWRS